jgi:hypothetical protein
MGFMASEIASLFSRINKVIDCFRNRFIFLLEKGCGQLGTSEKSGFFHPSSHLECQLSHQRGAGSFSFGTYLFNHGIRLELGADIDIMIALLLSVSCEGPLSKRKVKERIPCHHNSKQIHIMLATIL